MCIFAAMNNSLTALSRVSMAIAMLFISIALHAQRFVNTTLDVSPAGKPLSVFRNQAALVDAITARDPTIPGLSKRTLDAKFAAANRVLKKKT